MKNLVLAAVAALSSLLPAQLTATVVPTGSGCGIGAMNLTQDSTYARPIMGSPWIMYVNALYSSTQYVAMVHGSIYWGGLDLTYLGMQGCYSYVDLTTSTTDGLSWSGGVATWSVTVPNDYALVGQQLAIQALVYDPTTYLQGVNTTGWVTTHACYCVIGDQ